MKRIISKIFIILIGLAGSGQWSFARDPGSFRDPRDGREYKVTRIGNLTWFAENLAFKLPGNVSGNEYDPEHILKFGRLYAWEDACKACPTGWHLPSREEFEILLKAAGGAGVDAFNQLIPSGSSGFNVLFGGWRYNGGADGNTGNYACFWSATKDRPGRVWTLYLYGFSRKAFMYSSFLESGYSSTHGEYAGFSVRCILDK